MAQRSVQWWERLAATCALLALLGCAAALVASCGGQDLVIGGSGLQQPTAVATDTPEPTDTPIF